MTQRPKPPPESDETQALRADVYWLLAGLIREAPTREALDWLTALEAAPAEGEMARHWAALSAAAGATTPDALKRAHFRHLIGVIEGEVIPYASWYRHGALMDEALLSVRRDLRDLGIARSAHTRDPEDHLAALLEVMALLTEARAPADARFFMHHLAPWASRCFADLAAVDTPFYSRLGQLGRAFIDMEHERLAPAWECEPIRLVDPGPPTTAADAPLRPFTAHD